MRPRTTAVRRLVAVVAVLILSGVAIAHHEHIGRMRSSRHQATSLALPATHLPQSLGQALVSARYAFYSQRGEIAIWYADNPAQRFRVEFTALGIQVTTSGTDGRQLRVGMSLRSIGYGARQKPVLTGRPGRTTIASNSRDRQPLICPWRSRSGMLIRLEDSSRASALDRPPGDRAEGEPLRLTLSLDGDLSARVNDDGQAITFTDAAERAVLRYDKLAVTDGRGRRLPARMETSRNALWLDVEDRDAVSADHDRSSVHLAAETARS